MPPKEGETGQVEATETTQEQTEEQKETSEASEATSEKKEEKKESKKEAAAETETEQEESVEVKNITRDADGNYVWIVNPQDPQHTTVYKGNTLDELLANAAKGIQAKDSYIAKLKKEGTTDETTRDFRQTEEAVEFPDYGPILEQALREARVDPKYLQFSQEDWKNSEVEHGALYTMELKQAVKSAKQLADGRYAQENVKAINDSSLDEETDSVRGILEDYGIKEEDFEEVFDRVLNQVYSDRSNFKNTGVRKEGRVVALAAKEAKRLYESRLKDKVETETEEQVAKDRVKKRVIVSETGSRSQFKKPAEKVYKNNEDIVADLLRTMK